MDPTETKSEVTIQLDTVKEQLDELTKKVEILQAIYGKVEG
ncbi:MAG: hypothetical protein O3C20_08800 [Verrucomicrobia bacterium]|nr:hypothetical protein [Verrucomicrobiota bacterium]